MLESIQHAFFLMLLSGLLRSVGRMPRAESLRMDWVCMSSPAVMLPMVLSAGVWTA
jgi:hypothetical protein